MVQLMGVVGGERSRRKKEEVEVENVDVVPKKEEETVRLYMSSKSERSNLACWEVTRLMQQFGIAGHCVENLGVQCSESRCWREPGVAVLLEDTTREEVGRLFRAAKHRLGGGVGGMKCAYVERLGEREGSCVLDYLAATAPDV